MLNCKNCYTCQQGISPDVTAEKWATMKGNKTDAVKQIVDSITYFVFLTNDCNLRCSYCYAHKKPLTITDETIEQFLKFLLETESERISNRNISIQFFGGEPTLQWDYLQHIVEQANIRRWAKKESPIRWGMTTNCTLLDEGRVKWLRRKGFKILLSIDGPKEIHDLHRRTKDGAGSFDMIPLEALKKYFPNTEVRPTIMPDTVERFPDTLRWFYDNGFHMIATELCYEAPWDEASLERARRTYEKLTEIYIQRKRVGLPVWMKFIEDGRQLNQNLSNPVCGTARNSLGIDATGNLYACQRYASFSDPANAIGNIWDGLDKTKLGETQFLTREIMVPEPDSEYFCDECPARYRCRGGCNAANHQHCGNRRIIMKNYCLFQRLWTGMSLAALSALGELKTQSESCRRT